MTGRNTLLIICLLYMPGIPAFAETARIAVAANFTSTMRDIVRLFEQQTDHKLLVSYGSTGKLFAQITNGAPFDVFLSADIRHPIRAEQDGLAVAGSHFTYARGELVLWSPKPGQFSDGIEYLKSRQFDRLAIGNPRTAPYGLAASQTLNKLSILEELSPRLVRGDSIAQAFQFVATGNAEAGLVAHAQVMNWKGNTGSLWVVPEDYYTPIDQGATLLRKGEHNPAAQAFMRFLSSEETQAMIQSNGYRID